MTETNQNPDQNRQRRTMLMVVAIAALPAVIAAVLVMTDWRPSGRSLARGELLQPVRLMPKQDWQAVGEVNAQSRIGEGKWLLLTIAETHCDANCEQALYSMQQARLLTNKDMRRVERVLLTRAMPAEEAASVRGKYAGTALYRTAIDAGMKKLLLEDGREPHAWIFLIDPMGNLVLRYAPGADTAGLYKDLLRLLRLSQIG